MRRFLLACGMNMLVPGTGLMVLGRLRLGLAIALCFGLVAEVALGGILIAPAILRWGLTVIAACLAGATWLTAQALLGARIRLLSRPGLDAELAVLQDRAEEALGRSDHEVARAVLRQALLIDDSALRTRLLWAGLLSATASRSRARRAWMAVARLDANGDHREEVRVALGRLSTP